MNKAIRTQVLGSATQRTTRQARVLASNTVQTRTELEPGIGLYRAVRASALLKGQSFLDLCAELGVERGWAQQALTGARNGAKAKALRARLVDAVGLEASNSVN